MLTKESDVDKIWIEMSEITHNKATSSYPSVVLDLFIFGSQVAQSKNTLWSFNIAMENGSTYLI